MQHLQNNTTLQGGKYRIEHVLGQGGFGITYLATQVALNRQVAIKEFFMENLCERCINESTIVRTISKSNVSMVDRFKMKFLKEARIIAELHHENIIEVYDVFEENGTAYYVMEYIEGGSLGKMLQEKDALSEDEAINYITKVANAVEYLHQRKINHFDIKPDNIMLRCDNTPVLIDFGISKRYDFAGSATTTTPVGISNGYAPIEQYSPDGVATFSPQTDIYSLGATLYKLITGQTPPSSPARSGGASLDIPTNLRQSTHNAINDAMKINKEERYSSVKQFIDTLVEATKPEGSSLWKNDGKRNDTHYEQSIDFQEWKNKRKKEKENEKNVKQASHLGNIFMFIGIALPFIGIYKGVFNQDSFSIGQLWIWTSIIMGVLLFCVGNYILNKHK